MDFDSVFLVFCFALFIQYFETRCDFIGQHSNEIGHPKDVPGEFQVTGDNAGRDFNQFVDNIQRMAAGKNVTAVYKVRVELEKSEGKTKKKKKLFRKLRSKSYNVPLKKQNMKLSNFEVLLRKLAEENGRREQTFDKMSEFTTMKIFKETSTKQIQMKYKPIIGRVKTNFTKIVRPVRNRIITLN